MNAPHIVDSTHVLGNLLTQASPDMMRTLLQTPITALLSADADQGVAVSVLRHVRQWVRLRLQPGSRSSV